MFVDNKWFYCVFDNLNVIFFLFTKGNVHFISSSVLTVWYNIDKQEEIFPRLVVQTRSLAGRHVSSAFYAFQFRL